MTHLFKPGSPAIAPRTRCGKLVAHTPRGDLVVYVGDVQRVNCTECLADLERSS